ncbi:MAG: hypothetical protein R3246_07190, partial [Acidimicrobiia bacterium]|nr:hypothetical protein [Acidimicrobiia bacterium]
TLDLVAGASRPSVRGVVERTAVASNPLPWGSTISAVTRVWGGVTVERWATDSEIRHCLVPDEYPTYEAVGIEEVLVPVGDTASSLELAALQSEFGPPVSYTPSAFDRAMAWLRVFPSVLVVAALVGWSVVALWRRRHRPSDGYLF